MPPIVHAVAACRLSNYCLAAVHLDVVPALLMQVVELLFPALLRCQPQQDFLDENAELFRCVCVGVWGVLMFLSRLPPGVCCAQACWALCRSAANPSCYLLFSVLQAAGGVRQ
jgi:hypothetical protein